MNFLFVSPGSSEKFWKYCSALHHYGVTVLGVGEIAYEQLDTRLTSVLTEYYKVESLHDYSEVFKAAAYFSYHYGKIDWVESQREKWLELDARLRSDFNVKTGVLSDAIGVYKSKFTQKDYYKLAGVVTIPCVRVSSTSIPLRFAQEVGYPVFAKREEGTGAIDVYKIEDLAEMKLFLQKLSKEKEAQFQYTNPFLLEQYVEGEVFSYDAVVNSFCEPIFECMTVWPSSVTDVIKGKVDMSYYVSAEMDSQLRSLGRASLQSFGISRRFVHLEFFKLTKDYPALGPKDSYVGMEVNLRPAGGLATDMMCWCFGVDVYDVWAKMVVHDGEGSEMAVKPKARFCVYASRRDNRTYLHTEEEILALFGDAVCSYGRTPESQRRQMGDWYCVALASSDEQREEFVTYVNA